MFLNGVNISHRVARQRATMLSTRAAPITRKRARGSVQQQYNMSRAACSWRG